MQTLVAPLAQGDLISTSHFVSLGAHASTFHPDTAECEPLPGQDAWVAVGREIATRWGVIVTQTCDLIRPPDKEGWIQVAPLVDLGSDELWERASHGRDLDYFALPQSPDVQVAFGAVNGQLSFPVEKAALLHDDIQVARAPLDPAERIWLSIWLARRCGRHAFPDVTENLVLRPLRGEIARRWSKPNTQAGAFVHSLLGVWASAYEDAVIDVYFIMDPSKLAANVNALPDGAVIDQQAEVIMRACHKKIAASGSGVRAPHQTATLDAVPADQLLMRARQVDMELLPAGAQTVAAETAAQAR